VENQHVSTLVLITNVLEIPQYILDSSPNCRVLCTQPRRLAAISLAKRVAQERKTKIGEQVGFSIGGLKVLFISYIY
jgi:hypothetical protein